MSRQAVLAEAFTDAMRCVAVLRGATLLLARRPGPEDAERALLRLAIRQGVDLGPAPPLTGPRLGLWRCWRAGTRRGQDELRRRERWAQFRVDFGSFSVDALREVMAVDGAACPEAELALAERAASILGDAAPRESERPADPSAVR